MTTKSETRKVPAAAMRFDAGPCEFGQAAQEGRNVPVKIIARTGQPIDHWFWGKVIHDLAGMKLHKKSLTIDYLHYDDEILGYIDRFDIDTGDLIVAGELVPFTQDDRASEVIHKAQNNVPYEASIYFSGPLKVEEIDPGAEAKVNGYTVEGPAMIFRQWSLQSVGVCPHGMDRNTKTQLTAGDADVPVTILKEEGHVMGENSENKTADPTKLSEQGQETEPESDLGKETPPPLPQEQAETPPEPAGKQAESNEQDPRAECKRFINAFGAENGAKWFADRKTFAEAQQLHAEGLAAEIAALKKKLANVDRGEQEALSGTPEGGSKVTDAQKANFGDGLSALVAHNEAAMGRGK